MVFVSTSCIRATEPLVDRVKSYQSSGLVEIELGAGVTVGDDWMESISRTGGRFLLHNYFPPPREPFVLNMASPDEAVQRRSLDFVMESIRLSAGCGAPFYSFHAGFVSDPVGFGSTSFVFPPRPGRDAERFAFDRFVGALREVNRVASDLGVQVLIENNVCSPELRGSLLLQTAEEFVKLFEAVASLDLGILLDTGHLNVSAMTLGLDRLAFVNLLKGQIRAVHLHDNDGRSDAHLPVHHDSWTLNVLSDRELCHVPVIVEAKFETVCELSQHVEWLKGVLAAGRAAASTGEDCGDLK